MWNHIILSWIHIIKSLMLLENSPHIHSSFCRRISLWILFLSYIYLVKICYELIGAFTFSVPKTRSMQIICVIGHLYWNPRIEIMPLLSLVAATTNTDAASDSKVNVMVTLIVGRWVCYGSVSTGCYYVKLILIYTHNVYGVAWINMIWHDIILVRHFSEPTCGFVHRDRCQITIDPCWVCNSLPSKSCTPNWNQVS